MVRLTLHSVLRQRGIPGNWLTCEIIPVQIAGQGDAVLVQLVVLKWHDALMQYAPALQQGILEGLKHFDANANASKYHFSWAFAPDCGCPHAKFPEPSVWNTGTALAPIAAIQTISPPAAVVASMTTTPSEPKFDLPPLPPTCAKPTMKMTMMTTVLQPHRSTTFNPAARFIQGN